MKKQLRFIAVGLAALSFGLSGCGADQHPSYSASLKYGIRTDPIVKVGPSLGDERYDFDRPGQFPLMKMSDMLQPDHPYYPKRDKITDGILRDPSRMSSDDRQKLESALEEMFGTPAKPIVNAKEAQLDEDTINKLKLDDKTLAMGSTRYRIHCLHCHGVAGDGRGPTASWINPHPRDFRPGKFKFVSVNQVGSSRPPSRDDLKRTLKFGLEGTAMPSFNLLTDDEIDSLVSYVIHLSVRGNVELNTINAFTDSPTGLGWKQEDEEGEPLAIKTAVAKSTRNLIRDSKNQEGVSVSWKSSLDPANHIPVEPYPYKDGDLEALKASVKRGQQIFLKKPSAEHIKDYSRRLPKNHAEAITQKVKGQAEQKGKKLTDPDVQAELDKELVARATNLLETPNCINCHKSYGRDAMLRFDDWGTLVRPNNLTQGILRGGKRPVDIYYRIHSGIAPSTMLNFGDTLSGQEIWDLVNFVSILPYPAMREKLGIEID